MNFDDYISLLLLLVHGTAQANLKIHVRFMQTQTYQDPLYPRYPPPQTTNRSQVK